MATTSSPPLLTTGTTTTSPTAAFFNNGATAAAASSNNIISPPSSSSSSSSSTSISTSIIIVIIVIASAIIISASIYLILRFFSRRCNRRSAVRSISFSSENNTNIESQPNDDQNHHVIYFDNNNNNNSNKIQSLLPMFTFSSLTGNIAGGDCAVCLSKFESVDQLRLLPLCCHAFHTECIDVWLKSNQTCPLCRSSVNPSEADVFNKIRSVSASRGNGNRNRNNNGHFGNSENGGNVSNSNNNNDNSNNNSFRIEIGSVSQRRTPSDSGRRSYNIGSYEYVLEQSFHEIPIESIHRREISGDKDLIAPDQPVENLAAEVGESGRRNWLRDYVDRMSVSISSRSQSFRSSGRFFTGSSRRSEMVDDFEANHSRVGEEISELFRWLSGV
uniref:E3 ubiquitin-protein ligase ATL4-like n=1 Tax=Erigeron canadensis TaxID=72917 RepID=UPI001CB89975|nr:E3 ubiquitin-protein ligase ATL4-like [Erigeron canadensis]